MFFDKTSHELDTPLVLHDSDLDSSSSKEILFAHESCVLANDNYRNTVEKNGTAAHRARRECCVELAFSVHSSRLASGVFKCVHFAMKDNASLLDPLVVTTTNYSTLMNKH